MYYNNKLKIIILIVSIITILAAIFSIAEPNLKITMPIVLIFLGLQQLLIGVNSFKLHKKTESITSIGVSIFIFLYSIASIIRIVS